MIVVNVDFELWRAYRAFRTLRHSHAEANALARLYIDVLTGRRSPG